MHQKKKMKFTELNLDERINKGIAHAGFVDLMPVQEQTFVETFSGRDVLVQSQTGSGKTAAFVITIFHLFLNDKVARKRALIVAPTRELALQIEEESKKLAAFLDYRIGCFYGGVGYEKQESLLRNGVDIIIGTPGRLLDFAQSGKLKFQDVGIFVIDEADRLFDMGFYPDLQRMMRRLPPQGERITMLYSATLDTRVRNLAWKYMTEPAEIEIDPEQVTVETVVQELYHTSTDEKFRLLLGILERENPSHALIFTNMKVTAEEVAWRLTKNGYSCEYIMGDLPQKKRSSIIESMKNGQIRILVATDVAARGLHIDDLQLVINYDMPQDKENYVHRIGRTARAGKTGKAISLACEEYVFVLEDIESFISMKIPVVWADESLIREDVSAKERFRRSGRDRARPGDHRRGERRDGPDSRDNRNRRDRKRPEGQRSADRPPQQTYERKPYQERPRVEPKKRDDAAVLSEAPKKRKRRRRKGKGGTGAPAAAAGGTLRPATAATSQPLQTAAKAGVKKKGFIRSLLEKIRK